MTTKNTLTIPVTLLLMTILAASSISLMYAEQSALPPQVIVITNRLKLIPDGAVFDLPVDEPCYVAHGFAIADWKTYPEKGKWLSESVFTLEYGEGVLPTSWTPVKLKKWMTHVQS